MYIDTGTSKLPHQHPVVGSQVTIKVSGMLRSSSCIVLSLSLRVKRIC